MAAAPGPAEIFDRAAEEGRRRLDQSLLELVATSFIAGTTIVFGVAALGIVHASFSPAFGELARPAGALAFGIGMVFLIIGRSELFNENFFDPVAAAIEDDDSWLLWPLARLWAVTFAVNLVGGALIVAILSVEGALPSGTSEALISVAEETIHRSPLAGFASAIAGGALVSLLSFMLEAVDEDWTRFALAYAVGFLLALGPFEHVVVTVLHLLFGLLFGAGFGAGKIAGTAVVVTGGNIVGGLGLTTFSHAAQAIGAGADGG